jgi:hypothetical protein
MRIFACTLGFLVLTGYAPELARAETAPQESVADLWSMNLSGDFGLEAGRDVASFYPAGAVPAQPTGVFPGFALAARRGLGERFYLGAALSSLPKTYTLTAFGSQDQWQFSGLLLDLSAGWILARWGDFGLFAEAQAGWLSLMDGSLTRGSVGVTGSVSGNAPTGQAGVGLRWFILPSVALELQGGWRAARVGAGLSVSGGDAQPPSGTPWVDFGGPFGRLGLDFFWGLSNPWGTSEAPPPPPPPASF